MNKKKKKKLKLKKSFKITLITFLSLIIIFLGTIIYFQTPVSRSDEKVIITIKSGASKDKIAKLLKANNLIKSTTYFKIKSKLSGASYYAASYELSPNMTLNEIIKELQTEGVNINETTITIKEGQNMRQIAKTISENSNLKYEDIINKTNDKEYLNKLIKKYWFIKKDIKNDKLYYALEGYFFPDTYQIDKETTTIEEIFDMMLNQMETILNEYKTEINKSSYSVHKLLTLASVTQSEGYNEEDFKNIASVFYNRMAINMPLGSCVTSYYGVKKEMTNELLLKDINAKNAYNTRGEDPVLFPVGPISAPGKKAIEAVVKPIKTKYYYFVSDKNHKLYFTKTVSEHEKTISKLEQEGLWLEW